MAFGYINTVLSSLSMTTNNQFLSNTSVRLTCGDCINKALPFADVDNNPSSLANNIGSDQTKLLISDLHSVIEQIDEENNNSELSLKNSNCKYYECQDFYEMARINKPYHFSALHLNLASINKHIDDFSAMLALLNHEYSVIGISESRLPKGGLTNTDYEITGYSIEHTPTESSAGDALLYISKHFSYQNRTDSSQSMYQSRLLESVFVEIIFSKTSNIIVGSVYRHPSMSVKEFNTKFLTPLLHKIGKENKDLILPGDFNINLLKYTDNNDVSNFIDILGSHLILLQILLPTRISEHSKTLIDNIFTSVTDKECISGNIIHAISDHLPQFCLLKDDYGGPELPSKIEYYNKVRFQLIIKLKVKLNQIKITLNRNRIELRTIAQDCH